ncbi:hypothetical protein, partial [Pseudomonas chlororaphis]|uniref:hypothetical protein n=1 Tax=Pseudomonas chlororaphis TaxID=587753 RepID=UPI001EE67815
MAIDDIARLDFTAWAKLRRIRCNNADDFSAAKARSRRPTFMAPMAAGPGMSRPVSSPTGLPFWPPSAGGLFLVLHGIPGKTLLI